MQSENFNVLRASLSIMDLAIQKGYQIQKKQGMKHPVLKNDFYCDKIIISNPANAGNQGYWNPHNDSDKGHIYHFIKNRLYTVFQDDISLGSSEFKSVISIINKYAGSHIINHNDDHEYNPNVLYNLAEFKLPKLQNVNNHSYLQQRGIKKSTIENSFFKDRIFYVKYGDFSNIAFPYWDNNENIIGLEIKNYHYKRFIPGSNKKRGIWFSNMPEGIKDVYLFESVLDALSYHQLKLILNPNSLFVSFGGNIASEQLITLQKIISKGHVENQLSELICCTDNDSMGEKHFERIKAFFYDNEKYSVRRDCPYRKDFNEDVVRYETVCRLDR